MYSAFRRRNTVLLVCNTDWTVAQKLCMSIWYTNYSSQLDKSQCHTSRQVLMDDYCSQGKADYSDMIVN